MSPTLKRNSDPVGTRKYKKKPVSVRAVPFNPRQRNWPPRVYETGRKWYVGTANGDVEIKPGTWVCWQRVRGKLDVWPVAPEIFNSTYEPSL